MSRIFDDAVVRYREAAGTDWKAPLAKLYARYERASDERIKRRLEEKMIDAFVPMAAFLSLKHSRPSIGFTASDAFDAGLVALPSAFRRFDPALMPTGRRGLLSFAAQYFEWEVIHAKKKAAARAAAGISSLDALESLDSVPALAEDDADLERVGQSGGVRRVVCEEIGDMPPVDAFLATTYVLEGRSMREVEKLGGEAVGQDVSRETWRWRWKTRVRPRLQAALDRAGYGPDDIGTLSD